MKIRINNKRINLEVTRKLSSEENKIKRIFNGRILKCYKCSGFYIEKCHCDNAKIVERVFLNKFF